MVKNRKNKANRSKLFEYLPNEIFYEIFSYLKEIDIHYTFSKLNTRFEHLLLGYCQVFDFQSISKHQFDLISQYHYTNRWKSLIISDTKPIPDYIDYFSRFYSLINDFPQLRSLSILNLNIIKHYPILSQISSLTNLVSLTLESICGAQISPLDLPNLKRLVFTSCANIHWIQNFSQLETIEYTIDKCFSHTKDFIWPLKLKYLKIIFQFSRHYTLILNSLGKLSSLLTLEIYQKSKDSYCPNGRTWENLIRSSLPSLTTLKFYFQFEYLQSSAAHAQIIASFSTPFYIRERNWFISYDIPKRWPCHFILLNSLPFVLEDFMTLDYSLENCILTSSNDYNPEFYSNMYKHIKTLRINRSNAEPTDNFRESHIINLTIYVDFHIQNWIHVLTKLRHLDIDGLVKLSSKSFHLLLDNTPNLCSLNIRKTVLRMATENWGNVSVCDHLSRKIQSLKLYQTFGHVHHFSQNELQQILRIFGPQCQHLSLFIDSPDEDIRLILQNMSQLHTLHINNTAKNSPLIDILWLEKQQTKFNRLNCTIVNDGSSQYFWLGKPFIR